jgi:hypothetical protein
LQGEVEVAHNAAVTAEEDTTVIALSKEEFDLLLSASYLDHVLADDSRKDSPDNWFFLMSGKSWNMNRSIVKGHLTTR